MVKIGDPVTFSTSCIIDNKRVLSKALDDRVGLFVAIETVKKLKKKSLKCTQHACNVLKNLIINDKKK